MRAIVWLLRLMLFLLLFGLALNNMSTAQLNLLFGLHVQAPLFMLLIAAFVAGAIAGSVAMLPALLRARRLRSPAATAATAPRPLDDGTPDGV